MVQSRIGLLFSICGLVVVGGCSQLQLANNDRIPGMMMASQDRPDVVRANNHTDSCCEEGCEEGCVKCDSQIEFGQPNEIIDGIGWLFGIPAKILLWDRRAENHDVSPQTAAVVRQYVRSNGMTDVKVRVNQYAPGDEWRRLTQNEAVSPLWRYSFGALSTVGYTLLPGRLFGRDNYNPFTNTVSIYSDIPSIAVHEAAYARDNANHHYRGTYGFGQQVAGVNIWHETQATRLAHDWMRTTQPADVVSESDRILPPLYGMRVGGSVGELLPPSGGLFTIAGAITGHAVGSQMNHPEDSRMAANETVTDVIPVSHSTDHQSAE